MDMNRSGIPRLEGTAESCGGASRPWMRRTRTKKLGANTGRERPWMESLLLRKNVDPIIWR